MVTWYVEVVRNARALKVHPVYIAEHGLQEFYLVGNQPVLINCKISCAEN